MRDRDAETTGVQAERKRLEKVLIELEAQIEEANRDVEKNKRVVTGTQSHISDEYFSVPKSFSQLVDLAGGMGRLRLAGVMLRRSLDRVKQLKRLARSAYFGRIDFRETGSRVHPIYIGISSLTARETGEHLVFDWRAPVSSVYYDYELGEAKYESPAGTVYGEVLLKRHFKVRGREILLMYDNDLTIFDEILQDTLGKATGDRMKAIVNTIQREQNRVIRDEGRRLLLVQGAAGSGKTSIALHRAAYLLYKHRDRMSSHDILMVTPNRIFEDYTSPVLPELGEEPLAQSSFADLARDLLRPEQNAEPDVPDEADGTHEPRMIDAGETPTTVENASAEPQAASPLPHRLEDLADQLEYLLDLRGTPGADIRSAGVKLKSGEAFVRVLDSYADHLTSGDLGFPGLVYRGQVLMSTREAADLVFREYTYLPFVRRIEKAKRRMMWILDRARSKRYEELRHEIASDPNEIHLLQKDIKEQAARRASEEFEPLRKLVHSFRPVSFVEAYRKLFAEAGLLKRLLEEAVSGPMGDSQENSAPRGSRPSNDVLDAIRRDTLERLDSGVVPYEDLGPLLYLKGLLEGLPQSTCIRHVIVDEAQDYGALQFRVLRMAFPNASFTVLGDLNQTLSPAAHVGDGGIGYEGAIRGLGAGKDTELVRLEKSYRSTKEITEFTKAILREGQPVEPIERPGERPLIIKARDRDSLAAVIASDIRKLQEEGFRSIAVICRTARESWTAYESLKARISRAEDAPKGNRDSVNKSSKPPGGVRLVTKHQRKFIRGALVIPSYLAKGLEFEAVIIYDAGNRSYGHPDDRLVLYTACTRALHRLHVYHTGRISPVLADVDPSLYQRSVHSAARAY